MPANSVNSAARDGRAAGGGGIPPVAAVTGEVKLTVHDVVHVAPDENVIPVPAVSVTPRSRIPRTTRKGRVRRGLFVSGGVWAAAGARP